MTLIRLPENLFVSLVSGEPTTAPAPEQQSLSLKKSFWSKLIPGRTRANSKIDLLITNYAFPMQFITQPCLQEKKNLWGLINDGELETGSLETGGVVKELTSAVWTCTLHQRTHPLPIKVKCSAFGKTALSRLAEGVS